MREEKYHAVKSQISNFKSQNLRFDAWNFGFSWTWRLAILALPFQTRWFSDASLAGWPWEQGRWSVYASWILIVLAVVIRHVIPAKAGIQRSGMDSRLRGSDKKMLLILIGFIALTLLMTSSRVATVQWWIQILLLVAFVWTLVRARIPSREIMTWFVISLLPHVALGFWQYAVQNVDAMKWLGIAAQDPRNLGASVVEAGPFRTLRAYGGFPHPNIFGGWLAIGLVTALACARDASTKYRAALWSFASAMIAVALFLTYARAAWIAAIIGMVCLGWRIVRHPERSEGSAKQFFLLAIVSAVLLTSVVAFSQRTLLLSRVQPTGRLEQKSIDARMQSVRDGLTLFIAHPLFGTGPNAELVDLARIRPAKSRAPLEPPHDAYLLALVDVGILGILILGWVVWKTKRAHGMRPSILHPTFAALLILGLFDHYLWSLWAGQALVAVTLLTLAPFFGKVESDIV